jgi:hypothetical protein
MNKTGLAKALNFSTNEYLLLFIIIWLSLDFAGLGKFSFISMGDNGDVILPGLMANKSLGYGSPFWHVFSTSGNDRFSQGFFGAIDDWLFGFFPSWLAYQIRAVSQVVAAVLGTYFLCRRTMCFSVFASSLTGFMYAEVAMNGQIVKSVMAYLPLTILAMSLTLENPFKTNRWVLLIATGFLISLTAYLSRLAPFIAYAHFLWFVFIEPKRKILDWAIIIAFSIFVVTFRIQDYMATISYGLISHRHAGQIFTHLNLADVARNLLPSLSNIMRLTPHLFLLFALVVSWKSVDKFGRVVAALVGGVTITSLAVFVKPFVVSTIPLLGSFDLIRLNVFLWLFISIGAGSFIFYLEKRADYVAEHNATKINYLMKFAPTLALLVIFASSFDSKFKMVKDWISQGSYVYAFESPVLEKLAQKIRRETLPVRASAFQIYPNLLHPYGIETVGGYQALHLKRFNEFWNVVTESSASYVPGDRLMLNPSDHKSEWNLAAEFNVNLLSLANMKYIISRDHLKSPNLIMLRNIDKAWHSLSEMEKIKSNFKENFSGRTSLFVYENSDVFPRIFLANNVRGFDSPISVLNAMKTASINELREFVFLENKHLPNDLKGKDLSGRGKIILQRYTPDEMAINIKLAGDAMMVVTNGYSPYWSAEIDERPAEIFPVYHTFWGIYLPKSAQKVTFKYEAPWDWR